MVTTVGKVLHPSCLPHTFTSLLLSLSPAILAGFFFQFQGCVTICRLIIRQDTHFFLPHRLRRPSAIVSAFVAVVVISHTHFKSQLSAHNAHR